MSKKSKVFTKKEINKTEKIEQEPELIIDGWFRIQVLKLINKSKKET